MINATRFRVPIAEIIPMIVLFILRTKKDEELDFVRAFLTLPFSVSDYPEENTTSTQILEGPPSPPSSRGANSPVRRSDLGVFQVGVPNPCENNRLIPNPSGPRSGGQHSEVLIVFEPFRINLTGA